MDWLTDHKLPLGSWMEAFVDWLTLNAAGFFDAISFSLEWVILSLVDVFLWFPPLAIIALVAAIAYGLHRKLPLTIFSVVSLLLILNLGYWTEMIQTLVLVLTATSLSVLIGIPVGILAAHKPWVYTVLRVHEASVV